MINKYFHVFYGLKRHPSKSISSIKEGDAIIEGEKYLYHPSILVEDFILLRIKVAEHRDELRRIRTNTDNNFCKVY